MPDITPIRPSALANPTVEIIRKAVNAAHAAGLTVSTVADLGVSCTSTYAPTWVVSERVDVISPLGAVLLAEQPPIADADAALAHVLGANRIWVMGFDEGQSGQKSDLLVEAGPAARLYGQGFAAGVEFRAVMHRRQGVPVEQPAPEVTRPLVVETPRQLIADLLDTLTVSQGLEALADSFNRRRATLPHDPGAETNVFELTLREMADEARGCGV